MTGNAQVDSPRSRRPGQPGNRAVRAFAEGAAVSAAVALAWLVLASVNPTTTYHFAPLIAAIAAPGFGRYRTGRALGIRPAVLLAVVGAAATSIAAVVLVVTGRLAGPTLWGTAGSEGETVAAIGIGLLFGAAIAVSPRAARDRAGALTGKELPPSN